MSNTTPAVVVTALGLLACYGSTLPDESQQFAAQVERSQKLQDIADQIHSVIRDARQFENTFRALARKYAENDPRDYIDVHGVARLAELLVSVRGVEYGLKIVEAPEPLARLHMDLRRALAKGRSWLSVSHDLARQAFEVPVVVESRLMGDAVRALADHTTKGLVGMANA